MLLIKVAFRGYLLELQSLGILRSIMIDSGRSAFWVAEHPLPDSDGTLNS